jgi:uncharacterized membrane protein HdeD (DUF308 family)
MKKTNTRNIYYAISNWRLMLFAGLLLISIGIYLVSLPSYSYWSISIAFIIGMLLTGLLEIIFAVTNSTYIKGWGWLLVGGMMDFIFGIYMANYPLLSLLVIPFIVGAWMLFRGFMAIGSAIELRAIGLTGWGWLLFLGVFIILLSLAILSYPIFAAFNIVVWTGATLIISGVFRVVLSMKIRKIERSIRHL